MIGSTHTARSHYNAVSKIPFSQRQVPKACPTPAMLFLGSVLKTLLFDGFNGFICQDASVTLRKSEDRRRSLAEWHSKVVFQDFVTIIHKAEAKHIAECFAGQLAGGR